MWTIGSKDSPDSILPAKKSKILSKKVWHFRRQLKIIFLALGFQKEQRCIYAPHLSVSDPWLPSKKIHILNWRLKVRSGTFHSGLFFDFYLDSVQGKRKYLMFADQNKQHLDRCQSKRIATVRVCRWESPVKKDSTLKLKVSSWPVKATGQRWHSDAIRHCYPPFDWLTNISSHADNILTSKPVTLASVARNLKPNRSDSVTK